MSTAIAGIDGAQVVNGNVGWRAGQHLHCRSTCEMVEVLIDVLVPQYAANRQCQSRGAVIVQCVIIGGYSNA